jgi:hypothetical protein
VAFSQVIDLYFSRWQQAGKWAFAAVLPPLSIEGHACLEQAATPRQR